MILDTNAVSAWWQGEPSLLKVLDSATSLHLTVPVLAEFRFGILKSKFRATMDPWFEEAQRVTDFLSADALTGELYAQIRLTLESKGRKIPMNDLWIAAIARQHDLPIISRDTHFDAVDGIKRISW